MGVSLAAASGELGIVTEFMDGGDLMMRIIAAADAGAAFAVADRLSILHQVHSLLFCLQTYPKFFSFFF